MENRKFVITAAGGNATAIEVIDSRLSREEYEKRGVELMEEFENVEQSGFLILKDRHFEMSGGEFCGNAARSVAILLSDDKDEEILFTMSGFNGVIEASVKEIGPKRFFVSCFFPEFKISVTEKKFGESNVNIVDMGGIIHCVINETIPLNYEKKHKEIMDFLNLNSRDAVGVIWVEENQDSVNINPVVWVNSIDTFFYETSCGSGSIAVSKVFNINTINQPSGGVIEVYFVENDVTLKSEMEVL